MGKYFTVDVVPDIINGDVSNVQNANKSDLDIGATEIIFDWTAVDIPKGGCMLQSITAIVNAEDAVWGSGSLSDFHLIFAKSVNGEAPTTMGAVNAAQTACFDLKDHWVGSALIESTTTVGTAVGPAFHAVYWNKGGSNDNDVSGGLPMVLDLEPESGTSVGYDKLYVCGFQIGARHYGTGVIVNGAITSDTEDTITVDGVEAGKMFSVGDTVYLHDVDTALGTVKSVTDTTIVLNAAIAGGTDLDDDDELLNANPIKIKLGFER